MILRSNRVRSSSVGDIQIAGESEPGGARTRPPNLSRVSKQPVVTQPTGNILTETPLRGNAPVIPGIRAISVNTPHDHDITEQPTPGSLNVNSMWDNHGFLNDEIDPSLSNQHTGEHSRASSYMSLNRRISP